MTARIKEHVTLRTVELIDVDLDQAETLKLAIRRCCVDEQIILKWLLCFVVYHVFLPSWRSTLCSEHTASNHLSQIKLIQLIHFQLGSRRRCTGGSPRGRKQFVVCGVFLCLSQ